MNEWRTYRLSYTQRARQILETLTLEEKVSLMSGCESKKGVRGAIQSKMKTHYNEYPYRAGGVEEKGVPPMLFADGTRGVVCGCGQSVCFPVTSMRGATFDPDLETAVGKAMAEEVIAAGGNLFGGVCVNLPYHPGWGRAQETYGEDPCLLAHMGDALVKGVQSKGVIACVKHFAFNSMENSRFKVSVRCCKRAEREVFLPHFKACIDAGAGAVMSAYNAYEGVPCGHHDYLLNQVLKGEWKFDGFVMNDFLWGIKDTVEAVNGGMDMEMPAAQFFGDRLIRAVKQGLVKEERINEAALRILRTLLAHEAKSRKEDRGKKPAPEVFCEHIQLARRCAREGITLLKNKEHILPLNPKQKGLKILVLGVLADQANTGDKGSSQVYAPYVVTILEGIIHHWNQAEITYYEGQHVSHCRRLAKEADVVLIVAGNDYMDEGECVAKEGEDSSGQEFGGDRTEGLGLKERDLSIIRTVAEVRKDAVVVLFGGSSFTIGEWQDRVGAILLAYYPGMEGGNAVAEVLFGDVNPSGKLPFVMPEKETDLPDLDWNADEARYQYCHGYTLLAEEGKKPLYPFGFGLSYTTFRMADVQGKREGEKILVSVILENTGKREGAEVLQMYVGAKDSVVWRPRYVLKDFRKIHLDPGEKRRVSLSCDLQDMAYYNEKENAFVTEDIPYQIYVGTSSRDTDLIKIEV